MVHVAIVGAYGSAGSAVAEGLVDEPGVELTLIDDGEPGGGLCILRGCMPSKEVLSAGAHRYQSRTDERLRGTPEVDLDAVVSTKDHHVHDFAEHRRRHVHDLAEREHVEFLHGTARFVDERTLQVAGVEGGERTVEADYVVVATGSTVNVPDLPGLEDVDYHTSADVLDAESLPDSGVVMGFGYVGLELVPYLAEAGGTDLTVIEHDARPLDEADPEYGDEVLELYRDAFGVDVRTHTYEQRVEPTADGGVRLHVERRAPATDGSGGGGGAMRSDGGEPSEARRSSSERSSDGGERSHSDREPRRAARSDGGGMQSGDGSSDAGSEAAGDEDDAARRERERTAPPSPAGASTDASAGGGDAIEADELFLFTGRRPNLDGLGLEETPIEPGPGWVEDTMQAADAEHVFVVGDANGKEPILHVAKEQGYRAAENLLAHHRGEPMDPHEPLHHHVVFAALGVYPYVRIGHSAASAEAAGIDHVTVTTEARDDGVFRTKDAPEGRATLVVAADGTVLGYQGLHYHADVMAKTMQVVVELGLDVREVPDRAYHPTTPEILDTLFREAAAQLD